MMSVLKRKLHTLFNTPRIFMKKFQSTFLFSLLPDKLALKIQYKNIFLKDLDLDNPKTFNEKLQWLKLYNRKPEYSMMVDKYAVKEYVASVIGEEYIIPTYGVWDKFDNIDFDSLPERFVLKCTHGSGDVVICKDKRFFDKVAAKRKLDKSLKTDYYKIGREWPYKNVKPRIIAEKYMEDDKTSELRDYKFFCFDGIAKALFVATDRQKDNEEVKFDFFDIGFNRLDVKQGHPNAQICPDKPETFDEIKLLSERLSKNIPQLRVDFYEVNGKAYFGELTFSHFGGFMPFNPEEWDDVFGSWIDLSACKRKNTQRTFNDNKRSTRT